MYKNTGQCITIALLHRIDGVIGGNLFPGINDLAVHQLCRPGDILISSLITEAELRGIGSQQVCDIGKLLRTLIILIIHDGERNRDILVIPFPGDRIRDPLSAGFRIQSNAVIARNHADLSLALLHQLSIGGAVKYLSKHTINNRGDPLIAHTPVDPDIILFDFRIPLLVPLQDRTGISVTVFQR